MQTFDRLVRSTPIKTDAERLSTQATTGYSVASVIALVMMHMASSLSQEILIRNRVLETLLGVTIGMVVTIAAQMVDIG